MKYGWNDKEWTRVMNEELHSKFGDAVCMFNLDGFIGMMKRKTMNEGDMIALKALNEMVAMLNAHAEEVKRV